MPEQLINPQMVLSTLLEGASTRKKQSLDRLNELLNAHHEDNNKDFSIATIGRLSHDQGGPGAQSIRNKMGADYRQLIQVWAEYSGAHMKKPSKAQPNTPKDFAILPRITDPAIRAVVASIIAERNVLLTENRILKNQTEVIIDKRDNKTMSSEIDVLPAMSNVLNDIEQEALAHAISEHTLDKMGWKSDVAGRIKAGRTHIYKAGYVTAIQNVLCAMDIIET